MSIKSGFLTLSMREQICLTIIFLILFSFLVIVCIIGSLTYEILKEDYNKKKIFIYDRYKEYMESSFFFQNFNLLQYEEIIKKIQRQIWAFYEMGEVYNFTSNFENNFLYEKVINAGIENNQNQIDNDILYYLFYMPSKYYSELELLKIVNIEDLLEISGLSEDLDEKIVKVFFIYLYEPLSSLIISHDIESAFRLPGFDMPISTAPLFVSIDNYIMFSFNYSRIYDNIINLYGNFSNFIHANNYDILQNYFNNKTTTILNYINDIFVELNNNNLFLFTYQFGKIYNEIIEDENFLSIQNKNISYNDYLKLICGHFSSIDYGNDQFSLLVHVNLGFYYTEATIIDNYLFYMNNKMSKYLNISFIPLFPKNDTIISPELCVSFILKQLDYQIDENEIDELFKNIKKGESTIKDCFINQNVKIIDNQIEIKDLLKLNFSFFMNVSNLIEQGIMLIGKKPYYFAKYTYPNYNSLIDFNTHYILLDQINYYLFASFREPIEFSEQIFNIQL